MNSPSMATKEVKNGRLAMTAFVGFAVQVRTERGEREEGWGWSREVRQGQRGAAGTGRQRRL